MSALPATSRSTITRALVVGCGGLGSPASRVLMASGALKRLTLLDDDAVDVSNLHRQTLYTDADVGHDKVTRAAERLRADHPDSSTEVVAVQGRLRPAEAPDLLAETVLIEGADNFATKFLTADAARLRGVPVAHAGAVRWSGWALLSAGTAAEGPCLRCVFEDLPTGRADTCATAGVMGPVVGVVAALQRAGAGAPGRRPVRARHALPLRRACRQAASVSSSAAPGLPALRGRDQGPAHGALRPAPQLGNLPAWPSRFAFPPRSAPSPAAPTRSKVEGATVGAAIAALEAAHPGIRERVLSDEGKVLRFVNIFLNDDDIRFLDGLESPVKDGDSISVVPAIAGGR